MFFYLPLSLKYKDLTKKIMCISYFIGPVVKIVYLNFFTQRTTDFNKLKRNMNDGAMVFLASLLNVLT